MNIGKLATVTATILTFLLLGQTPSQAAVVSGVKFTDNYVSGQSELPLRGAALYRYLVVIKAYAGALYLPENVAPEDVLTDVPKHLVLSYFHAIKGEDFGSATLKVMRKNVDSGTMTRLMPKVEQFNSFYTDVAPGDRYAITYEPGMGTTLSLNGNAVGTIPGADFAAAIFSLWLGPEPIDEKFKYALLGVE